MRPEISEPVRHFLAELVAGEIEIVGDMVIALEAAFGSGPGVIVIAGTGSIAYGRNSDGRTARAGGWGFAISDEGSGHWIGRMAVAAAVHAADADDAEPANQLLLQNLMKSWQTKTREQLVVAANATPPPDFAALFPSVLSSADHGDHLAMGVLTQAGAELAGLATTVIARLFGNTARAVGGDVGRYLRQLATGAAGFLQPASFGISRYYFQLRCDRAGTRSSGIGAQGGRGASGLKAVRLVFASAALLHRQYHLYGARGGADDPAHRNVVVAGRRPRMPGAASASAAPASAACHKAAQQ